MEEFAIKVEGLTKTFKLPHEKTSSIKSAFINFYKRDRGYELQHALKNINLEIKHGEFFGIVGRNGSGKSTLLKLLAGIYTPTKGDVHVNGSLTPFIELGVGFNDELTGRENVYLNGALLGFNRKEMKAMYNDIVEFAELEKFMDQKLKNYSSGMQVRLAFSIAIRAKSDILLIDEVLAVGDAAFQQKCYAYFHKLKRESKTIVFVTHDMDAMQTYCDRAVLIQDSRIVQEGLPREVALSYRIVNTLGDENREAGRKENRPKNPAVKIKDVRVAQHGKSSSNFGLDDDIYVRLEFEVIRPTEIQFNLFFVGVDGSYLAGINTTGDLGRYRPAVGEHAIECRIKGHQLAMGEYKVGAGVYTHQQPAVLIDVMDTWHSSAPPRVVVIEKSETQDGKFYIDGKWSIYNQKK